MIPMKRFFVKDNIIIGIDWNDDRYSIRWNPEYETYDVISEHGWTERWTIGQFHESIASYLYSEAEVMKQLADKVHTLELRDVKKILMVDRLRKLFDAPPYPGKK